MTRRRPRLPGVPWRRPLLEALEARDLPSFLPAFDYPVGLSPRCVELADFQGDGRLDLAVANISSHTVSVLLGHGNGTFQAAVAYEVGLEPHFAAAGDFDSDGRLDLVVTNSGGRTLSFLKGNGDGTFQQPIHSAAAGDWPHRMVVADLDGDRRLDLVIVNTFSRDLSIYRGNGDGTFQHVANYAVGLNPVGLAAGDFNGDGALDLAVPNYHYNGIGKGNVRILLGNGDGTFQPARRYVIGGNSWSAAVADFDGDGALDLAATNSHRGVAVLRGNADGTFRLPVFYPAGTFAFDVRATDVNRDGRADLVVANVASDDVSVLLGNGDGTFRPPLDYAVGYSPFCVTAADLNGDGFPDLAVANGGGGTLSILLNAADWGSAPGSSPVQPPGAPPDDFRRADVAAVVEVVLDAARRHRKAAGMHMPDAKAAAPWMRFFETASEVDLMGTGAQRVVQEFRQLRG